MDKLPKRKVLSLSLSQPGKQHKKLRLKRHASNCSENDIKTQDKEDSQQISLRNDSSVEGPRSFSTSKKIQDTSPPIIIKTEPSATRQLRKDAVKASKHSEHEKNLEEDGHDADNSKLENLEHLSLPQSISQKTQDTSPPFNIKKEPPSTRQLRKDKAPGSKNPEPKENLKEDGFDAGNSKQEDFSDLSSSKGKRDIHGISLENLVSKDNKSSNTEEQCSATVLVSEATNEIKSLSGTKLLPVCQRRRNGHNVSEIASCITTKSKETTVAGVNPAKSPVNPSEISSSSVDGTSVLKAAKTPHDTRSVQAEPIEVLQCPLCNRNFDKLATKISHMKGCASKHKLTTQQLLEALELQQRQAAERRALGLPDIPSLVGNKKSAAPKKENRAISKLDGNMQLAMALSLSLRDQDQALKDSRKTDINSGITLDKFGFASKPVLEGIEPRPPPVPRGKTKITDKKKPSLLTRTAEERQRIITEKVAMVLLEEMGTCSGELVQKVDVQSSYLQECLDEETLLWSKSHTSPSKNDRASYYVKDLREFISPSKVEMGSKVMHLSQVVGRVKTPTKMSKQVEPIEVVLTSPSDGEHSSDSSSQHQMESKNPSHIEMELRAKLFNDWAGMVNNSTMSDLTIYPKEGRGIPAHKIILHVRCPLILCDVSRQRNPLTGNEVEVIMWSKTPHVAALAFLEYIYCGSVKSIRVLSEDSSSFFWLANHYQISDLLRYLTALTSNVQCLQTPSQVALKEVKDLNEHSSASHNVLVEREMREEDVVDQGEAATPLLKGGKDSHLPKPRKLSADLFASPVLTPSVSETESIYSEATLAGAENRSTCSSPDMFADDEVLQPPDAVTEEESAKHNSLNCERPPSRSASISSQNTVVFKANSPTQSPCASISSEKTEILLRSPEQLSPTSSNASATTEVFDYNQDTSKHTSFSLNDSKRKHSNSSQDGDTSARKRSCPIPPTRKGRGSDSDVECFDLTQDSNSNSNASFPVISNQFSGEYGENILISSDNSLSDSGAKSEVTACSSQSNKQVHSGLTTRSSDAFDDLPKGCEVASGFNASCSTKDVEPYVSPVWDGFEDLNYDDHFTLTQYAANSGSPLKEVPCQEMVAKSVTSTPDHSSKSVQEDSIQTEGKDVTTKENRVIHDEGRKESSSSSDCETTFLSRKALPKKSQPSSSSGFEALLDESLNVDDRFLRQAESGVKVKLTQRETLGTPLNRVLASEQNDVTPVMNYSAMKTPELKRELQKFGLKPNLGKRKGKIMLRHIYNELHPWVAPDPEESVHERNSLSQPSCSTSTNKHTLPLSQPNSRKLTYSNSDPMEDEDKYSRSSESDSGSDNSRSSLNASRQEIQYLEGDCDDTEMVQASQPVSKADLPTVVTEFITSNRELHKKILEYEPIWIEQLQTDIRNRGFKFKMVDLMAFLDEKCITFRTAQGGPRVKKKSRPGNSKKKTAAVTSSDTNELSD